MKLQWIKDILGDAYTEELDAKVSAALGERFVSRADFNAKNNRVTELGVERLKVVATFDKDICEICGALDGQVFKMSEYQVGLTAPPSIPGVCAAPVPTTPTWRAWENAGPVTWPTPLPRCRRI